MNGEDPALFVIRRVKLPRATRHSSTCSRGHALAGENLATNEKGWRICKKCRRLRQSKASRVERERRAGAAS